MSFISHYIAKAYDSCTFTRPAISRKFESHGTSAVIGTRSILTLVSTKAAWIASAFIDICNDKHIERSMYWLASLQ